MHKIFQISIEVNVNSVGKIAEQIGETAMNRGWESYITCCRNGCRPSKSKTIKIGNWLDVYWHGIMTRLFDSHCLHSTRATKKLIKQIESINPDVIHLHHIHGYFLNMKVLFDYLNKSNKPVVWTFHDCWSFTGHCAHFVTANCYKWKEEGCHNCPLKGDYPKSYYDGSKRNFRIKKKLFSANNNLHIITVSEWLASFTRDSFLGDKDIRVINNGVDIHKFTPSGCKTSGIFKIIGVASLWSKDKGLYDFYKLREFLPEDYEITLVGLTSEQIAKLPVGIKGITRTESVEQLARLYSEANVMVNPTYADSFPTVNMEALACGTPVITYRTGGSPEIIDDKTGVVVEQGDVEGLVLAIKQIKEHPLSSIDCRNRAVQKYDKDKRFADYVNLYESLTQV